MRQFEHLACQVCDKENQEGLNNQGHGNQNDVKRILQNDIALKRENENQRQKQARNGYVVPFRQECMMKVILTFVFDKLCPR